MIFDMLYESVQRGELILIDGGYCRWHLRKDGQITIYEIISIRKGAGSKMLEMLKLKSVRCILAKCPADLSANDWYKKQGFLLLDKEIAVSGREINLWRLTLD